MLTLAQYKQIKEVKDKSPFTSDLSIVEYINNVRFRLSQWYGIEEEKISDEYVYNFLTLHIS